MAEGLADFQEQFRKAIHSGSEEAKVQELIVSDVLSANARLQVYKNNYQMSLSDALVEVFPIVSAFVGEEFLRAAAKHFVAESPPSDPQLFQYGGEFPQFLATYSHAAEVVYVADIAALEWAVHELQFVASVGEGTETELVGHHAVNPNVRILESEFPLLQLWMVGTGQLVPEAVHIGSGGQSIAVVLEGMEVKLHPLTAEELVGLKALETNKPDDVVTQGLIRKNILLET